MTAGNFSLDTSLVLRPLVALPLDQYHLAPMKTDGAPLEARF